MDKKKKTGVTNKNKEYLVMTAKIENYKFFDPRANKPIAYISKKDNGEYGEMVLQEIETLKINNILNKKDKVDYFSPNNVGILLSISQKSLESSKKIINEFINQKEFDEDMDKQKLIVEDSISIYDYIEKIQSCIVFGYTALEAFTNLSIPNNFEYKSHNNKGVIEIYDKEAIERWLSLKNKIEDILVEIYETKPISGTNLWTRFLEFEKLRHSIIHQKSISATDFYKNYFHKNIYELCGIPYEIIKYFFDERKDKKATNPLWPWLINEQNEFPVSHDFNSQNFKIIGNLWDKKIKI